MPTPPTIVGQSEPYRCIRAALGLCLHFISDFHISNPIYHHKAIGEPPYRTPLRFHWNFSKNSNEEKHL